jgi:2-polyprenyl-3-methyl-5-hydroxy-6-metoxy-1,4-benzoquinol methylase
VNRVRQANVGFQNLRLEEEHRLALLNARCRLELIREYCASGRLLEVGCARGDFLSVAKEAFDVYGVEPNPELAAAAERVAPIHAGVIETLAVDGFDVAASFHVIEHVDSPRRFLQAMVSRVKSGGLVVLETPNIRSLPFNLFKSRWRQFIPEHYFFFDPVTVTRLMETAGLKVERIQSVGKYASVELILNRLSRYAGLARPADSVARSLGLSRLTFRINPTDIMLIVAKRVE